MIFKTSLRALSAFGRELVPNPVGMRDKGIYQLRLASE